MTDNESKQNSVKQLAKIAPIVRGLLAEPTGNQDIPYNPVILKSLTSKEAVEFADSVKNAEAQEYPAPLTKDQGLPLFPEALDINGPAEELRKKLSDSIADYSAQYNSKPTIICLRSLGILFVDPGVDKSVLPLKNKVALVTGAAGAIGYGICCGLLEKGCHLIATDLPGEKLDSFTADLKQIAGDRVTGIPIDVTNEGSFVRGLESISLAWGGIDIVVVNAGIPLAKFLKDIDLDDFRRLEKVNIEGTFLTLREIARHFILQGTGGDIIIVSTKNVPSPGAGFGAYSATKAASHQLGRIASLELAQYGVRVNMVAPDAVFSEGKYKSGLWEEIGPDRMKARGLDEDGLQEYYQSRNLLKAKVTGRHVSNAVLFFATRQTPTTGATIPVDGGLPDATPR
ncbi:MAG: SDR family NAD(P)-dependent oxidoreductase [Planctomycetes bacterium]|nr:SDR family NAD(P)-dependent oxidoreductase [Planctomycetota bacterium]MBL7142941.1 SDR family NAD(P)-dependent oxidoreductase [Phycisphaerae bacterium]